MYTAIADAFNGVQGYSFLIFNLLCAPCFAAMGAIRREMHSAKWTAFAISYQCVFAYAVALIVYQLGNLFAFGKYDPIFTTLAILVALFMIFMLVRPTSKKYKLSSHAEV